MTALKASLNNNMNEELYYVAQEPSPAHDYHAAIHTNDDPELPNSLVYDELADFVYWRIVASMDSYKHEGKDEAVFPLIDIKKAIDAVITAIDKEGEAS